MAKDGAKPDGLEEDQVVTPEEETDLDEQDVEGVAGGLLDPRTGKLRRTKTGRPRPSSGACFASEREFCY
jgi:hypothetical protein